MKLGTGTSSDPVSDENSLTTQTRGLAQAYWLNRTTIGWPVNFGPNVIYSLHYDPRGELRFTNNGIQDGNNIPLDFISNSLSTTLAERFPHLKNAQMLRIPDQYIEMVPEILRGQYAISVIDADGSILGITGLQIPGVLDDVYANNERLGLVWEDGIPIIRVWAPTAKSVQLVLYDLSSEYGGGDEINFYEEKLNGKNIPMTWDGETGIWTVIGEPGWKEKYYLFEIEVFIHQEGKIVKNLVTDPYSYSLSQNSTHSQIIDLDDPDLLPAGWKELQKPEINHFTDIALYELHLRDFSIRDASVPVNHRGTYLCFTHLESNGMGHLRWLSMKGITHIHLLPVYDFATVNEQKSEWKSINWDELASYPPDSSEQQKIIQAVRGQDGYNWGYDPLHFTVPEGSYSVQPDGKHRILEFREMVRSLNQTGLRVIMDVVYNHTYASGQHEKSILDRIVPGYYHRLDRDGLVTNSTCCQDTATEHAMMHKLMIDSVLTWAKAYKIDGFRFDLMGHHMKRDMGAIRIALDSLTIEKDRVDGSKIYIYGEGWDFGEVANNARGINASQKNMAGTGIGTFNDRIRDAVRGGSPFGNQQEQGFSTGLYTDPNEVEKTSESNQLNKLLKLKDLIRISLAGNLADYQIIDYLGEVKSGSEIDYNGQPAGYNKIPQEHIPYVSAHDNETLFDAIQYKVPITLNLEERIRVQNLALSIITFCQGVPFFHAGSEILRSKSMDRDSFDSTDWFNAIDWTYEKNNWGHGLPPRDKNVSMWSIIQPLLRSHKIVPKTEYILSSRNIFGKFLQIRNSSPLFRLHTDKLIKKLVDFHNTGPDQIPGLIVMSIRDDPFTPIDPNFDVVFVLFNADPQNVTFRLTGWDIQNLELHPLIIGDPIFSETSFKEDNQTFSIPGRSTVVFIHRKTKA